MINESDEITSTLLNEAVKFHGHLGPFLVLGLKAGLFANRILGKDYFKTKVIVETEFRPPYSCIIDGIQITTGCTMGKGNIEIKKGDLISLTITRGNVALKMILKEEILSALKNIPSDKTEQKALEIVRKPVNELFDIKGNF